MVILILSYKRGISLHVPLPMNVANARYHSLLGDAIDKTDELHGLSMEVIPKLKHEQEIRDESILLLL